MIMINKHTNIVSNSWRLLQCWYCIGIDMSLEVSDNTSNIAGGFITMTLFFSRLAPLTSVNISTRKYGLESHTTLQIAQYYLFFFLRFLALFLVRNY